MIERAFFHTYGKRRIYVVEYIPSGNVNRGHGVVLCKPIWGERIRTHRIFTNFARMIAAGGLHAITCDHFGDGNSAGDSTELDIGGMTQDIVELARYLEKSHGVAKTTLVGMLIGANAACLAGKELRNLEKLILVQPVLNPIEHLEAALRSNLSSQMVVHKKVLKDRTKLIEEIKSGIPVNVDGFMLGKKMWESYARISPFIEQKFEIKRPVAIVNLKKKASKGADYNPLKNAFENATIIEAEQEFVWTDWKIYRPRPPLLYQILSSEIGCTATI
jgi:pimeloyl-ACP methyl ester carboxylesterase